MNFHLLYRDKILTRNDIINSIANLFDRFVFKDTLYNLRVFNLCPIVFLMFFILYIFLPFGLAFLFLYLFSHMNGHKCSQIRLNWCNMA